MKIKLHGIGNAIFIVFFFVLTLNSNGQSDKPGVLGKVNIASPNAASLGKYTDVPVNLHTGIPQISIPIYSLKEGPLSLPISLSYHAGGVKIGDVASWVGLGWSLNAGGVITRTVRGTPDEKGVGEFLKNEYGHLSDNGYNNYVFKNDAQSPLPTHDVFGPRDFEKGIRDGEPDLFFFNFNGYSGKFYFNDDGQPVLLPESDYKIEYTYNVYNGTGQPQSIQKFVITVPDGTRYYFGVTDPVNDVDPIEKTHNFHVDASDASLYYGTNNTINSWYLNRIESADGIFQINLNYENEEYSYKDLQGGGSISGAYQANNPNNWKYYGHWVQGVRLASITSSSVSINFQAGAAREDLSDKAVAGNFNSDLVNSEAKSLSYIQVSNSEGVCKKFKFSYNYFTSDPAVSTPWGLVNSTVDLKRLKLTQINEESCDGTVSVPPYQFQYFSEPLPRRFCFAKDHWGFNNGKTSNQDLIPTFTENGAQNIIKEYPGADRDSYWPAMRAGTLSKIIYPTGGFSNYEFEPNTSWISYPSYNKIFRFSFSMGYDGNNTPVSQVHNLSGNIYRIKLINTNAGGNASVFLGCDNSALTAIPGQTTEIIKTLPLGNCTVTLSKPDVTSGNGVQVLFEEWVPTQIEENRIVGGLRIKSVSLNDGTGGSDLITSYSYNEANGKSSGHLYGRPTYVQLFKNDNLAAEGLYSYQNSAFYCSPYGFEYCPQGGHTYMISSSSLRPMESTQGNHIGYNEVKVYKINNGFSVYRFFGSNKWDLNMSDVAKRDININVSQSSNFPNYPEAPEPPDFKRGELKSEEIFNQDNRLLRRVFYSYDYVDNPLKTPALIVKSGINLAGLYTNYELFTSKKIKTTVQNIEYPENGGLIESNNEIFYESGFHNQQTKTLQTNSKNEVIETTYKYPADFKATNCISIDNGLNTYNNACLACEAQYTQNRMAPGHNTAFYKFWDFETMLKCKSVARISYFTARKSYYNPTNPAGFVKCLSDAKSNANSDLKPILELSDRFILSPVEISTKKAGYLINSSFTKYEFSQTLPAMVYPTKSQLINLNSPSPIFTGVSINGNGLLKDNRYTDETSVKIENGNIVEVTGKNGIVTSYIWSANKQYPIIKADNINYTLLKGIYDAVSGNLDLLRSQSGISGSLLNTYVYKLGVGIVKETNPNGLSTFYEYDKLNRLFLIRDFNNSIIKRICYNYAGQPEDCLAQTVYTNEEKSQQFTRNNCGACSQGSQVIYTVPAGTYSSTIDVQAANQLALNDIAANGQNYANSVGTCTSGTDITVNYENPGLYSNYTATYTNLVTNQIYVFNIPANSTGNLGCIPAGNYSLSIVKSGGGLAPFIMFGTGCHIIEGQSAYFGNVNITFCHSVLLDSAF